MRIGSLFSGYSGLDAGVQQVLGGQIVWHCEFDAAPSRILAHHWPDVPNLGDITSVDFAAVEPVDVLTGGFPCQDVSHAGRRAGLIRDGEGRTRSGLWGHMLRAVDTIRPSLVVAENVRGLLSAEADSDVEPCPWCMGDGAGSPVRALGAVLADLADVGYDAAWCGLRAADVGAPHGRFRVFILAWPADTPGDSWRVGHGGGRAATDADHGTGDGERARALPRRRSADDACLTLLPTPRTSDTNGAGAHGMGGIDLRTAVSLLPTPRATDGAKGGPNQRGSSGDLMLPSAVAMLPTPAVNDMGAGKTVDAWDAWDAWTDRMKTAHGNGNGHGASLSIEALRMLPTPSAADGLGGHERRGGDRGDELLLAGVAKEMAQLLPTPTATDSRASGGNPNTTGTHGTTLTDATVRQPEVFGQYAPAITRWEHVLGRPAPAPTESNREAWEKRKRARLRSTLPVGMRGSIRFIIDGPTHRLSPRFVEWLMGLPDGWVVDVPGLARNAQLKALGNGVVPQQAAVALRHLLTIREHAMEVAA